MKKSHVIYSILSFVIVLLAACGWSSSGGGGSSDNGGGDETQPAHLTGGFLNPLRTNN